MHRYCAPTHSDRDADIPVGFVVGALNRDFTINEDAALRMREAAGECLLLSTAPSIMVPDIGKGLETLLRLGYERVLTTGGHPQLAQPTAWHTWWNRWGKR